MKYQDHFPTIWDAPRQKKVASKKPANAAPVKQERSAFKDVFLSIWDSPKSNA
ncbi:MAG: hypothetical protein ACTH5D_10510 [Halomonas sp.]|uniref:hypothetical protein n=1 Tax=Halomonas sp. TaxID=1486246 RepID=UPI003F8E44CD